MLQLDQTKVKIVVRVLLVYTIIRTIAYRRPLMKPRESYIGIYVILVGQKMENSLHTHSLSVESLKVSQKRVKMVMTRCRHAILLELC